MVLSHHYYTFSFSLRLYIKELFSQEILYVITLPNLLRLVFIDLLFEFQLTKPVLTGVILSETKQS